MQRKEIECLVIGAGPGGYVAAIRLAQLGKPVMLVEKGNLGGVCLNVGCIPSKALITAAKTVDKMRHSDEIGISVSGVSVDFEKVQSWKNSVVKKLTGGIATLTKGNGVQVVNGTATFKGPHEVEIASNEGTFLLTAKHIVIATGSRPVEIPGFTFDDRYVVDSTGALDLDKIPSSLVVIGGGYIGLELGTAYAKLGSKVTVLEMTDSLLPGFDPEIVQVIARKLKKLGVDVHLNTAAKGYEPVGAGVKVSAQAGDKVLTFDADKILVTVGRRPNTHNIGIETTGVKVERGFITVNERQETNVPGIYAIGDVCGQPMLAHKASKEADVVAEVICGHPAIMDAKAIPAVVFTDPEIGSVGLFESEAKAQGYDVMVGKFAFGALGRAMTTNETDGFIKVVADKATHVLLGVHIVGPGASDLISEAVLAIEMGALADDLSLTVHPHPTLGEGLMEAAKVALGECAHVVQKQPAGAHR